MILASGSPRRVELMREAGLAFRAVPADIDESRLSGELPFQLVARLARTKALALVRSGEARPGELVVGADTVVVLDGEVLGKPSGSEEAAQTLRRLSGREHVVATGCALMVAGSAPDAAPVAEDVFVESTAVTFYDLGEEEIRAYVGSGEPMDKAGSYGIQGGGRMLVRGIEGDYYNVVGLPVARLVRRMRRLGLGGGWAR